MNVLRIVLVTVFALVVVPTAVGKEWRGITPLQSTRSDVVRLWNQCSDQIEACVFTLDREDVYILFSGGLHDIYQGCAKSLPAETVVFIQVEPQTSIGFKKAGLSEKTLKEFEPTVFIGRSVKAYRTGDGLIVSTFRNKILQMVYVAEISANAPCAKFYGHSESFIQTFVVHPPPYVVIQCESIEIKGSDLKVSASSSVSQKRGPTWTVNAGRIKSGQHTYKLVVDMTGVSADSVVVSADMADVFGHVVTGSCKVPIRLN